MNQITALVTIVLAVIAGFLFTAGRAMPGIAFAVLAVYVAFALKMANNWERFVILRAGKLSSVKGPGLFMIIPVIDSITAVIDERIQTTGFNAEQALTRDTVPVNVDAVIFWHVHDAQRAALNITDYRQAIDRVAEQGGGTVRVGPGRYVLRNAIQLRSKVRVIGTPKQTILASCGGAPCACITIEGAHEGLVFRENTLGNAQPGGPAGIGILLGSGAKGITNERNRFLNLTEGIRAN